MDTEFDRQQLAREDSFLIAIDGLCSAYNI